MFFHISVNLYTILSVIKVHYMQC